MFTVFWEDYRLFVKSLVLNSTNIAKPIQQNLVKDKFHTLKFDSRSDNKMRFIYLPLT